MKLSVSEAKLILRERKVLYDLREWKAENRNYGSQLSFKSRIKFRNSSPRGLWFRVILFPSRPLAATVQVDREREGKKGGHLPLYRLEWNPQDTHSNMGPGPKTLQGQFFDVGDTHEHCCMHHICLKTITIADRGVHTARRIIPDFVSLNEVMSYTASKLRIDNLGDIPPPTGQLDIDL